MHAPSTKGFKMHESAVARATFRGTRKGTYHPPWTGGGARWQFVWHTHRRRYQNCGDLREYIGLDYLDWDRTGLLHSPGAYDVPGRPEHRLPRRF